MYIGLSTIVFIVVIVLIVMLLSRSSPSTPASIATGSRETALHADTPTTLTCADVEYAFCGWIGDSSPRPRFARMSACNVTTWAEVANMAVLGSAPSPVTGAEEPFGRVARLAALVLGTPSAFVTVAGSQPCSRRTCPGTRGAAGRRSPAEQSLCQHVIDSGGKLIIEDARLDPRTAGSYPAGPADVVAWAGFPVRGPDGLAAGALCVADTLPRRWSAAEVEVLATLASVASGEIALQVAVARGAERAALAQTLQESLLPPRLPGIPGLQVAARYVAGGTGAEVLGDFYDVFPSVRGSWGMVVGDVCGKGSRRPRAPRWPGTPCGLRRTGRPGRG